MSLKRRGGCLREVEDEVSSEIEGEVFEGKECHLDEVIQDGGRVEGDRGSWCPKDEGFLEVEESCFPKEEGGGVH